MLSEALFERTLSWTASAFGQAHLLDMRRAFEARTGPIEESAADYESRIAHFFECYVCSRADGAPAVSRFAEATADLSLAERRELAGWRRSHRSLWICESIGGGQGRVRDLIGGLSLRIACRPGDEQLRADDRFDGRVVPLGDMLLLSPGRVFHPREAHAALDALLAQARSRGMLDAALLDPLLRMRSSFLAFASIRAEHVYRLEALAQAAGRAAWAARGHRPSGQGNPDR